MGNTNTEHSRNQRKESVERWTKEQIEAGAWRLSVMLPPDAAQKLRGLMDRSGESAKKIITDLINKC